MVLKDGSDMVMAQGRGVSGHVLKTDEASRLAIHPIQPAVGPNPNVSQQVLIKGENPVVAQASVILGVMEIGNEVVLFPVISVQAVVCSHPEEPGAVNEQGPDATVARTMGIISVLDIDFKIVPVISIESGFGADPEKAFLVLNNGINGAL